MTIEEIKTKFLNELKNVDIYEDDWAYTLIESLPNSYPKGFLTAKLDANDVDDSQELLEDINNWVSWDIWKI